MRRIRSLSITIVFIGFIFVPVALWLVNTDAEFSSFEKRRLAEFPAPGGSWESIASFSKRMENYYEDHFGLRDQLIALYSRLSIQLFGKSPDSAVTIGRDKWLFYNAGNSLRDFMGLLNVDVVQLEAWHRVLRDRQEWLYDQGTRYVMCIVPSKMMIYPEFLPARIQKQAGTPLMREFLTYLDQVGFSGTVALRPPLVAAKDEGQMYFRTDTHWNTDGAYAAYLTIMDKIQTWYPDVTVVDAARRESRQVKFTGDLGVMLHLSHMLNETAKDVTITASCSSEKPFSRDDFIHPDGQLAGDPKYFPLQNGCPDKAESALILHDSFGRYMTPYFDESFQTVIYSQHVGFRDLKGFVSKVRPSVIVDQRAARFFFRMVRPDPEIESYVLRKHFQESEDVRFAHDRDQFISINDIILSTGAWGILLEATGDDPFLELEFDHRPEADSFIVRVVLTSPEETTLQFFYTTSEDRGFSPERVISKSIRKGRNELLFRLPHPDTRGRIRFDPGFAAGLYVLHSLQIKGERFRI